MTTRLTALALLAAAALTGCATAEPLIYGPEPTTSDYTEPEESGLIALRPYPAPNDVCQVIGENDATRDLLDDSSLLIACPKHEKGALGDRMAEGARVVGYARHWTLLSVPL